MDITPKAKADNYVKIADDILAPSCWKCFSKPEYNDAIINYKSAAEIYHGIKDYTQERSCREKLSFCFMNTKSHWEEANEYDKIAQILIKEMHNTDEAMSYIENCNKCYVLTPDYGEAIRTMTKFGFLLRDSGFNDHAEKVMKIANENINLYFHLITMDKNAPTEYIYKGMDLYMDLLFGKNKIQVAVDASENFCKTLEKDEGDLRKMVHFYLIMCIGYFCMDQPTYFSFTLQKVKEIKNEKMVDDNDCINLIEGMYNEFNNGTLSEDIVNRKIKTLLYDFGNEIGKAMKNKLLGKLTQGPTEAPIQNNEELNDIGREEGNKDNFIANESNASDYSDYK